MKKHLTRALALLMVLALWLPLFSGAVMPTVRAVTENIPKIKSYVTTGYNTAVVTENGDLYMWGVNSAGEVGNHTTEPQRTPIKVLSNVTFVDLCHSARGTTNDYDTVAAITENGDLYMWGGNSWGEVGTGPNHENQLYPTKIMENVAYVDIEITSDMYGTAVGYSSMASTAAITKDGDLYMWGMNWDCQIGCGQTAGEVDTPTKILSNVSSVQLGRYTTAAITSDQSLYVWGMHAGDNSDRYSSTDTPFKVMDDVKCFQLDASNTAPTFSRAGALTNNGDLYVWGYNEGTLGNGSTAAYQSTPVKILSNVETFSLDSTSSAITKNKDLYMWGYNYSGEIGNNSTEKQTSPQKILSKVDTFKLAGSASVAITSDMNLYAWGHNSYGQVGNGTTDDQLTPYKVLTDVVSVHLDEFHTAAITSGGDLYIWGENSNGEIGNGSLDAQYSPLKVLENVISVEFSVNSNSGNTAAITSDGRLYVWGSNTNGQVGNNSTDVQLTPVHVLSDVASVSWRSTYPYSNIAAITTDGSLYLWGSNAYGQVGNGTTEDQRSPYKLELSSGASAFNEYIYRADYLANDPAIQGWLSNLSCDAKPGRALAKAADETGYSNLAIAWKALELSLDSIENPSAPIKCLLDQADIYSAIILDAFRATTESTAVKYGQEFLSETNDFISFISNGVKINYGLDLMDKNTFRNLDDKTLREICKMSEEKLKQNYPQLSAWGNQFGNIMKVAKITGDFTTFCSQLCSYVKLYTMSDSMKAVLIEMRDSTANSTLRQALDDCIRVFSYSQAHFIEMIGTEQFIKVYGTRAMEEIVGWMWGDIMTSVSAACPGVGVLLGAAKAGVFLSNVLCNTDEMVEQHFKLLALLQIEDAADVALRSLERQFMNQKTQNNAEMYLDAVDVRYTLLDMECDAAYEYIDALDSSALSRFLHFLGVKDNSDKKQSIRNVQSAYQEEHTKIQIVWVYQLDSDYPELFDYYYDLLYHPPIYTSTNYLIACPVDVYVYDSADQLVAWVENETPYANGSITASVENHIKKISISDDGAYRIVCQGYDAGTMDITVTEYAEGEEIRKSNFYDLPLSNGQIYEIATKEDPTDTIVHVVEDGAGHSIQANYDSNVSSGKQYTATIVNGYVSSDYGPEVQRTAYPEESVEICAYVPEGYRFVRWRTTAGNSCLSDTSNSTATLRMPEQNVTVTAVLEKIIQENPFVDVSEDWYYYKPVLWALENNITTGVDATHFMPEESCTRGQVVTFLWRANGCPEPQSSANPFTDVKQNAYYYKAVLWAAENGITTGVSATRFAPEATVTRGQFVTFLWRAEGEPEVSATATSFTDLNPSQYYYKAVLWAAENSITAGMTKTTFAPENPCTRGQVVTFLWRDLAQ